MIETYFLFALATLTLAVAPGPDNIFVLTQSVARGSRYGIAIASGLISGCVVHTSFVALGFALVVKENIWLLFAIKILGSIYLLYLAFQVFKQPATVLLQAPHSNRDLLQSYLKGVTMNLLNPKVTLFFLALLPKFIQDIITPDWLQIYILGGIFMLVSLAVFYTLAVVAGQAKRFLKKSKWFPVTMKWLQICVFVGIAIAIFLP